MNTDTDKQSKPRDTLTLRLRSPRPDSPEIIEAAQVIRDSGVVVFPTETVYGIGAGLDRPEAVHRVAALKQRPAGMPFLVHCAGLAEIAELVREMPAFAFPLFEAFLPGPLAVILPASERVPAFLRGSNDTVGIRVTAHPVTQGIIRRSGMPLVGSSANLHTRPATAEFSGLDPVLLAGVDLVIDAGRCGTGLASTVIDLAGERPRLVREGAIPRRRVEALLGQDKPLRHPGR